MNKVFVSTVPSGVGLVSPFRCKFHKFWILFKGSKNTTQNIYYQNQLTIELPVSFSKKTTRAVMKLKNWRGEMEGVSAAKRSSQQRGHRTKIALTGWISFESRIRVHLTGSFSFANHSTDQWIYWIDGDGERRFCAGRRKKEKYYNGGRRKKMIIKCHISQMKGKRSLFLLLFQPNSLFQPFIGIEKRGKASLFRSSIPTHCFPVRQ